MPNTIKLTKAQMGEILDGKYLKGDFEKHYRHNGGTQVIIFEKDGKHWETAYRWFEDEGVDWWDEYDATEVHQVEKMVKVWEPV